MNETIHNVIGALYGVAGWCAVLAASLVVCVALRAAARALSPVLVGVLVRVGVIE